MNQMYCVRTRKHMTTSVPPGQPSHMCHYKERTSIIDLLLKPALYTVGMSVSLFGVAAIIEHETKRRTTTAHGAARDANLSDDSNNEEGLCQELSLWWSNVDLHKKTTASITGLAGITYWMWTKHDWVPFMAKWFLYNPRFSGLFTPILLSQFCHLNGVHLLTNIGVLYEASVPIVETIGAPQFFALFLSGGAFGCLLEAMEQVLSRKHSTVLGASASVGAVMGATATLAPEARIFNFAGGIEASTAMAILLLVDVVYLIRGGSGVSHAGHIGGTLFGLAYGSYGKQLMDEVRPSFLNHYIGLKHTVLGGDESS